jgi:hypothetical protein
LQVTKVDFIGIPSTDFDRSMAFYADTLVCHMAFFKDPDGNTIILHRRYKPRG